jgi:hypothetical protein
MRSGLDELKDQMKLTLQKYEHQRGNGIADHRAATIKKINELLTASTDLEKTEIALLDAIRQMKHAEDIAPKDDSLPEVLRACLTNFKIHFVRTRHDHKVEAKKEFTLDEKTQAWHKQFSRHVVSAMRKSIDHPKQPEFFQLFSGLLGPKLYHHYAVQTIQDNWNLVLLDLPVSIQAGVWEAAYAALKPYEEKLYRELIFSSNQTKIQQEYQKKLDKISGDHLNSLRQLTLVKEVTLGHLGRQHVAGNEVTTECIEKLQKEHEEKLKALETLQTAYRNDSKNYTSSNIVRDIVPGDRVMLFMPESDLLLPMPAAAPAGAKHAPAVKVETLTSDDKKAFAELVKISGVDKKNVTASENIHDEFIEEFIHLIQVFSKNKYLDFSGRHASLGADFQKSIGKYIEYLVGQFRTKLFKELNDRDWNTLKISDICNDLKKKCDVLAKNFERHSSSHYKSNCDVDPKATQIKKDYADKLRREGGKSLSDEIKSTLPDYAPPGAAKKADAPKESFAKDELLQLAEAMDNTHAGELPPDKLLDLQSGKRLIDVAIDLYKEACKTDAPAEKREMTQKLVYEFLDRGYVIHTSPMDEKVGLYMPEQYDAYAASTAWTILEKSFRNVLALSGAAQLIKQKLIEYCQNSAALMKKQSKEDTITNEKKLIDKVFQLLKLLQVAYENKNDSSLLVKLENIPKHLSAHIPDRKELAKTAEEILKEIKETPLFTIERSIDFSEEHKAEKKLQVKQDGNSKLEKQLDPTVAVAAGAALAGLPLVRTLFPSAAASPPPRQTQSPPAAAPAVASRLTPA